MVQNIAHNGSKMLRLRKKRLQNFDMRCWTRLEKIKWRKKVSNEDVLGTVDEERSILTTVHHCKGLDISLEETVYARRN